MRTTPHDLGMTWDLGLGRDRLEPRVLIDLAVDPDQDAGQGLGGARDARSGAPPESVDKSAGGSDDTGERR